MWQKKDKRTITVLSVRFFVAVVKILLDRPLYQGVFVYYFLLASFLPSAVVEIFLGASLAEKGTSALFPCLRVSSPSILYSYFHA